MDPKSYCGPMGTLPPRVNKHTIRQVKNGHSHTHFSMSVRLLPTCSYVRISVGFIFSNQHNESENCTLFKSGAKNHQMQRVLKN